MAGTVLLFSTMVLKALQRMGERVEPRAQEDFVQLWGVVGAMLGVPKAGGLGRGLEGEALARLVRRVSPVLGRPLLEAITTLKLGGVRPSFAMPTRTPSGT